MIETSPTATIHASESVSPVIHLVGGRRLLRDSLILLLRRDGLEVAATYDDEQALAQDLQDSEPRAEPEVVLLVLSGVGPFGAFRRLRDTLDSLHRDMPLVVLSDRVTRGQVYAAIRIGAKGYVGLDAAPHELVEAIVEAARGKAYLVPDAAQLLVSDISATAEPNASRLPTIDLSKREVEVVQLLCEGLTSKEIGRHLHISPKTVENHRYNIYRKCEVDGIASLMRHAIHQGLVTI